MRNNRLYNKINVPTHIDLHDNGLLVDLTKVKNELHENHLLNINKELPAVRREVKKLRRAAEENHVSAVEIYNNNYMYEILCEEVRGLRIYDKKVHSLASKETRDTKYEFFREK